MCTNPVGFGDADNSSPYELNEVIDRLASLKTFRPDDWETESLCLTGGEPTSHPQFIELMKRIRIGFPKNEIILATNGRMFSYPSFAKEFLDFNPKIIEIAIHGSTSEKHDAITRVPGSFDQAIVGAKNILKHKKPWQELEIRVILLKLNLNDIGNILGFIARELIGISRVVVIFPEFEGVASKNLNIIDVRYSDIRDFVSDLIIKWKDKLPELRLYHFPLCVLPYTLWPYAWRTLREEERAHTDKCDICVYEKYCLGMHVDYLHEIGDEEFNAITEKFIDLEEEKNEITFKYHPIVAVKEKNK